MAASRNEALVWFPLQIMSHCKTSARIGELGQGKSILKHLKIYNNIP